MPRQTKQQLKKLVAELLPLAEAGEHYTGGCDEAEARRRAETLAQARKVAKETRR